MKWHEHRDHENKNSSALVNKAKYASPAHKKPVRFASVHDQLSSYNKTTRIHPVQSTIKTIINKNVF